MIDRLCGSQTDPDVFYDTPVGLSPFDPDYTLENPNGIRDFAAIDHLILMLGFPPIRKFGYRGQNRPLHEPPGAKNPILTRFDSASITDWLPELMKIDGNRKQVHRIKLEIWAEFLFQPVTGVMRMAHSIRG